MYFIQYILIQSQCEDDAPAAWEINNSIIDKQRKIKKMKMENGPFTKTQNRIKHSVLFFNPLSTSVLNKGYFFHIS
jgi:hypothetical protein